MTESRLLHAQDGIQCVNCFYFRMAPTGQDVVDKVPYCDRRGRQIGWNPLLFMCGDFGIRDEPIVMQTKLDWRWGAKT
ncbi:MAG: hypothetical protein E7Z65_06250 [Thermoplasmata archaeon]|nr:hypothetical protein [Thermoplasmata archaeon]